MWIELGIFEWTFSQKSWELLQHVIQLTSHDFLVTERINIVIFTVESRCEYDLSSDQFSLGGYLYL